MRLSNKRITMLLGYSTERDARGEKLNDIESALLDLRDERAENARLRERNNALGLEVLTYRHEGTLLLDSHDPGTCEVCKAFDTEEDPPRG